MYIIILCTFLKIPNLKNIVKSSHNSSELIHCKKRGQVSQINPLNINFRLKLRLEKNTAHQYEINKGQKYSNDKVFYISK